MFASCGGSHNPFNKTFFNVSLAIFRYHDQGLIDQETNVEMNLSLSGMFLWLGKYFDWMNLDRKFCDEPLAVVPWNKLHLIWIIGG